MTTIPTIPTIPVDTEALKNWIGRTETASDLVTAATLAGLSAARKSVV